MPVSLQVSGANFTLNWSSTIGLNYQIQYKDDLAASNWTSLGNLMPGTGGLMSATNNITSATQRFYRILIE
jgi:hypothetical protein